MTAQRFNRMIVFATVVAIPVSIRPRRVSSLVCTVRVYHVDLRGAYHHFLYKLSMVVSSSRPLPYCGSFWSDAARHERTTVTWSVSSLGHSPRTLLALAGMARREPYVRTKGVCAEMVGLNVETSKVLVLIGFMVIKQVNQEIWNIL